MWHDMLYRSEGAWITMQIWPAADRPMYTQTDSGCKLWQYINNRSHLRELWEKTRWLVDRFHGGMSHNMRDLVRNFCRMFSDVSKMDDAEKPPGVSNRGNSQAQEQNMAVLGRFYWTFNMNAQMQWFFLFWLTLDMNELLLEKMEQSGKNCNPPSCAYL